MRSINNSPNGNLVLFDGVAKGIANNDNVTTVYPGGTATFAVFGTFGSGTVALTASFDGGSTFLTLTGASFTSNGSVNVQVGACILKCAITGATSPTVKAVLAGIPEGNG